MTPTEAIKILDNVTAQVTASRQDHAVIQQAIQVLREATAPVEDATKGK